MVSVAHTKMVVKITKKKVVKSTKVAIIVITIKMGLKNNTIQRCRTSHHHLGSNIITVSLRVNAAMKKRMNTTGEVPVHLTALPPSIKISEEEE